MVGKKAKEYFMTLKNYGKFNLWWPSIKFYWCTIHDHSIKNSL